MVDIVIRNGKVVFPDLTLESAIAVDDGKIVAIGSDTVMPKAEKVIDAKGKFVLPGGIDTHDHTGRQGFFLGTKATSSGGTTTLINFSRGGLKGLAATRSEADSKVVHDYTVHATIGNITAETPEVLDELKKIIEYGVPSFKLFMVYGSPVDDSTILKVFEACKAYGGILCLHAENRSMVEYNAAVALKQGHKEAIYHAITRPPITEAEPVNMAIYLSSYTKAPYMTMHLSTKEAVDLTREARKKGELVYGEACYHYLCRTEDDLKDPKRGFFNICTPPFRTKEHIDALWEGLRDGTLSTVGSDGGASDSKSKMSKANFAEVPPAGNGRHEFLLPILFSEGMKRHMSINKLSEVYSTNAAKIYGLYPKKGIISIGSDADLVVLDPKREKTITMEDSVDNVDWNPFEGMKVKGWPTITISKGKVLWEDGNFEGKAGDGEFLKRKLSPELFKGLIV